jgi:hypothetical protein
MIDAASVQMAELVDSLALVARIESGSYQPVVQATDTLGLVHAARDRLDDVHVEISGDGATVAVDPGPAERALAAFAECVGRHGGVDPVLVEVRSTEVAFSPVPDEAVPVLLAEDLRDLGAATAHLVVGALGGSVQLSEETLVVSLPPAAAPQG